MAEQQDEIRVNHTIEAIKSDLQPGERYITSHDPKMKKPNGETMSVKEAVKSLEQGPWENIRVIEKAVNYDGTPAKNGVVTLVGKWVGYGEGK